MIAMSSPLEGGRGLFSRPCDVLGSLSEIKIGELGSAAAPSFAADVSMAGLSPGLASMDFPSPMEEAIASSRRRKICSDHFSIVGLCSANLLYRLEQKER